MLFQDGGFFLREEGAVCGKKNRKLRKNLSGGHVLQQETAPTATASPQKDMAQSVSPTDIDSGLKKRWNVTSASGASVCMHVYMYVC
jgi:hypothetical protein